MTRREMDLARSVQVVTEEIVLKQVAHAARVTGEKNLCLAGGVALNCVANGRILRESSFENVWIQPAAGDAGGALGAALHVWHQVQDNPRTADGRTDSMRGAYLGPDYPDRPRSGEWLDHQGYPYRTLADGDLEDEVARLIDDQNVVGMFQGRMEFGPRALGNRSIIGDARSTKMQSVLNLKIKYRESFRPFAPSCMEERIGDFFDIDRPSPYMLLVAQVQPDRCLPPDDDDDGTDLFKRVYTAPVRRAGHHPRGLFGPHPVRQPRDQPPLPRDHQAFEERTGYGIIINTSFNVRGEPIVCTPEDAYRCFMRTEMDYPGAGESHPGQDRPAGHGPRERGLAGGIPPGLTGSHPSGSDPQKGLATVSKFKYIGRLFREIFQFAMQNKAWWIVPTVLILLLLGRAHFLGPGRGAVHLHPVLGSADLMKKPPRSDCRGGFLLSSSSGVSRQPWPADPSSGRRWRVSHRTRPSTGP